jgi:hypothetical protein
MPPIASLGPPHTPAQLPVPPWLDSEPPLPLPKFDQPPAANKTPTPLASPVKVHQSTSQPYGALPPALLPSPPSVMIPTPLTSPVSSPSALPVIPSPAPPPTQSLFMSICHPHSFGPAGMPSPQSHTVPYISRSVEDSWEDFLKEYEDLGRGCRLTEQEKCKMLLHYIALSYCNLCRSLDEYSNSN